MIRVSAGAAMLWPALLWIGLAVAAEAPKPAPAKVPAAPDAELLEFLGSFETSTGQWPELNELLATRTREPAPPLPPKEEVKR